MLVEEAIYQVRCKTNDRDEVGLDDVEILNYINEAIQFINAYLVGANSPILIKELLITEPSIVLPKNFVKTCGSYPARITGNIMELLDEPPMKLRYFESFANVGQGQDDMPFDHEALNQVAIKLASIYANAQQQLDVSQDKTLLDEVTAAISSAISGAI